MINVKKEIYSQNKLQVGVQKGLTIQTIAFQKYQLKKGGRLILTKHSQNSHFLTRKRLKSSYANCDNSKNTRNFDKEHAKNEGNPCTLKVKLPEIAFQGVHAPSHIFICVIQLIIAQPDLFSLIYMRPSANCHSDYHPEFEF